MFGFHEMRSKSPSNDFGTGCIGPLCMLVLTRNSSTITGDPLESNLTGSETLAIMDKMESIFTCITISCGTSPVATNTNLPLLMVYELDDISGHHHVVCFQDPLNAGSVGVDVRTIVGRFEPTADGRFNPSTFQFNTAFVNLVAEFMNAVVINNPNLAREATYVTNGRLEVIDPRCLNTELAEVPMTEILGWFAVDEAGAILKDSFLYNHNHLWFEPDFGTSGLLSMKEFYEYVHADRLAGQTKEPERGDPSENG